jgi:LAO/AO transport system kinase
MTVPVEVNNLMTEVGRSTGHGAARLVAAARSGDRRSLSRALSLIDSDDAGVLSAVDAIDARPCWVIGLTGAAGVGKSTLTGELLHRATSDGLRVAVLAVDPSSLVTGGALLGDRVRMAAHVDGNRGVFVRSLATRARVGGLSRACHAAVRLLVGAEYDTVFIETVGAGQSEIDVRDLAHTVLVLVSPSGGDWLQAAKGGLMEIGDVFAVTKADTNGCDAMLREVRAALLLPGKHRDAAALAASARSGAGLDELWHALRDHRTRLAETTRPRPATVSRRAHDAVDLALGGRAAYQERAVPRRPAELLRWLADRLDFEGGQPLGRSS